jgi:glycine/D-amino acid oxidase-like deaminating enzyme
MPNDQAPAQSNLADPGTAPDGTAAEGDPGLDRRTFLKRAGAHTGLLAAGAGALTPLAAAKPARDRAPFQSRAAPDVVVIGAGAFGGWTAHYLQTLGANVTLVDAWGPGNSRATSGDETRGIRSSYGDRGENSELWCRWAREAMHRWKAWDEEWGRELRMRLFYTTGDIILRSSATDNFITETRKNWEKLGTPHEVLSIDEVNYRWSAINTKDMVVGLYEPEAGVGRARRSCEAVSEVVRHNGGRIITALAHPGSNANGQLNDLTLKPGMPLSAGQYVFACGPWLWKVFPEIFAKRMRTSMGSVFYFGTPSGDPRFVMPNMPSWNFPGITGWPSPPVDYRGFRVRTGGGRGTDPETSERWVDQAQFVRARQFLADKFPGMAGAPIVQTHSCHYESSISRNFVIDHHPDWSNVWIAGCGNAEGFKFGPVIGDYVARRVLGQENDPALIKAFRIPEQTYDDQATTGPQRGRGGDFSSDHDLWNGEGP